jgi:transcriptional regulator GlxA family with amidase domain
VALLPLAVKRRPRDHPAMRIEIPLYADFDEVDAVGPFEVLANAAKAVGDVEVALVGAHGPGEVVGGHGARFVCEAGLSDAADLVVVPGGGWRDSAGLGNPLGARREYDDGILPARLRDLHAAGAVMASVCTGGLLLGRAGLLRGRPATTHRACLDDLAATGALVDREARVVDDGDLLTCGGVTSGLDLALHLVEREWGDELAQRIARLMEHDRRGPVRRSAAAGSAAPA